MYLAQSVGVKSCFNNSMGLDCYLDSFLAGNTKATFFPVFGGGLASIFQLNFLEMRFIIITSALLALLYFLNKTIRLFYNWKWTALIFSFLATLSGLYYSSIFYSRDIFWMFGIFGSLYYLVKQETQSLSSIEKNSQFLLLLITLLVRPVLTPLSFLLPLNFFYGERLNRTDFKVIKLFMFVTIITIIPSYYDLRDGVIDFEIESFLFRVMLFIGPLIYLLRKDQIEGRFRTYLACAIYGIYITPFLYELINYIYISLFTPEAKETLGVFTGDYLFKFYIMFLKFHFPFLIIGIIIDFFIFKDKRKNLILFYFLGTIFAYVYVLPKTDLIRFVAPFCLILFVYLFKTGAKRIIKSKWAVVAFLLLIGFNIKVSYNFPKLTLPDATRQSSMLLDEMTKMILETKAKIRVYDVKNFHRYKWILELHSFENNKLWKFEYIPSSKDLMIENKTRCLDVDYWMHGPLEDVSKISNLTNDFIIVVESNWYHLNKCHPKIK